MENVYEICFYGGLVFAILLFVAAVVLFIVLKIPKVIGELSGSAAKKAMKEMQEGPAKTGSVAKKEQEKYYNMGSGKITAKETVSSKEERKTQGNDSTELLETPQKKEKKFEETDVLRPGINDYDAPDGDETEVLGTNASADEATDVLRDASKDGDDGATDVLRTDEAGDDGATDVLRTDEVGDDGATDVLRTDEAGDDGATDVLRTDEVGDDGATDVLRTEEAGDDGATDVLRTEEAGDDGATDVLRTEEAGDDGATDVLRTEEAGDETELDATDILRADEEEGTSVLTTGPLAKVKVIYNIVVVHSNETI